MMLDLYETHEIIKYIDRYGTIIIKCLSCYYTENLDFDNLHFDQNNKIICFKCKSKYIKGSINNKKD